MHAAARLKMDANMTCTVREFYDNIGTFNLIFRSQTTVSVEPERIPEFWRRAFIVWEADRTRFVRDQYDAPRRVRGLGSAAGRYPYQRRRREAGARG